MLYTFVICNIHLDGFIHDRIFVALAQVYNNFFILFVEVDEGTEADVIYFDTSVVCIRMLSSGWNTMI